jgi:hypothetical protein
LGVDWHTAWNAIEIEAKVRTGDPTRLTGVKTIGVDEHIGGPAGWGSIGPSPSWLICRVTRPDACMLGCSMPS